MGPAVSVVIAAYNYARYLGASITSALQQTFSNIEVIVVDDGSTDDTPNVVAGYLSDERLRYIRTPNRGQSAAENQGIRLARGEFVAFLDADDIWLPHKLERQLAKFGENANLGVVYSRRRFIDPEGRRLADGTGAAFRGNIVRPMFRENFICFSSSVVKRSVFDRVGCFNESYCRAKDYDLWLRVALHYEFDYVDEPLVLYRRGHASLTKNADVQLRVALMIMNRFVKGNPGRVPRSWARQCYRETYEHLGLALRDSSRLAAMLWYGRAIALSPGSAAPWKGLGSQFLTEGMRRALRRRLGKPVDWRLPEYANSER